MQKGRGGSRSAPARFRASRPSLTYKTFVNRCLREKGYDPIGWE